MSFDALTEPFPRVVFVPTVFELRSTEHVHDYVHLVYTERRGDARTIVTGLRCSCGEVQALDYLPSAA